MATTTGSPRTAVLGLLLVASVCVTCTFAVSLDRVYPKWTLPTAISILRTTDSPIGPIFCECGQEGPIWSADEKGRPRCKCKSPECPFLACPTRDCLYGVVRDKNGCDTCKCQLPPFCKPAVCPLLKCAHGLQRDRSGCEICKCNPAPCPVLDCAPVTCFPNDEIAKDRNGCETCVCPPLFCRPVDCLEGVECPFPGYAPRADGCPSCACRETRCPEIRCPRVCPYGYQQDSYDCDTCVCNPPPVCPKLECPYECPRGYQIDITGCQTCECNKIVCPKLSCYKKCPYGAKRDSNGCISCECYPEIARAPIQ